MSNVTSFEVTGDWRHIVDDGMVDGDDLPDEVPLTGKVVFKPVYPSVATAGVPVTAYTLGPVTALVAGGVLTDLQGRPGIKLAGQVGEHTVRWSAETSLRFQEQKVDYPRVTFELAADVRLTGIITQAGPSLSPIVVDPRIEALAASVENVNLAVTAAEGHASDAAGAVTLAGQEADRAVGLANAQDEHIAGTLENPTSATHAAFKAVGNATYETSTVPASSWPAAGQRAARRRDRGIDAAAEFGVPVASDVASAVDAYPLGLQAAVAAAGAAGGELFLRRGVTSTGTRLFVTHGTVIRGEGPGRTTLYVTGTAFQGAVSDVLIKDMTIMGDNASLRQVFQGLSTGGNRNWRFENVRFVNIGVRMHRLGAPLTTGGTVTSGCGIDEYIEFDHCVFTGWLEDAMVWAGGTNHVSLNRCELHTIGTDANKGDMVKYSYGAKHGRILDSDFRNGTRDAVDLFDCHSVDVIGNTMANLAVCAIESKFTTALTARRIRVHRNTAVNCQTSGNPSAPVFQLATSATSAHDNLVDGSSGAGFRAGPATDSAATVATEGIWTGNRAYNCAGDGFALTGTARHIMRDNVAKDNAGRGYYVSSGNNAGLVGGASANVSVGNGAADVWAA